MAFLINKKVIKNVCMSTVSPFEKFWMYESQVLTSTHHRESSARQDGYRRNMGEIREVRTSRVLGSV